MTAVSNPARSRKKPRASVSAGGEDASKKERILSAAMTQFAEKGFAAVRIDEVAADAGANKQLIYYYFDNKAGLYEAALARLVEMTAPTWAEVDEAPTLERALERYRRRSPLGALWRRFFAWEGVELSAREGRIPLEKERTAAWAHLVGVIEAAQAAGELRADLDARMFALMITSFTSTAAALPQIAKMIVGVEPDSDEFADRQSAFIGTLIAALRESRF